MMMERILKSHQEITQELKLLTLIFVNFNTKFWLASGTILMHKFWLVSSIKTDLTE